MRHRLAGPIPGGRDVKKLAKGKGQQAAPKAAAKGNADKDAAKVKLKPANAVKGHWAIFEPAFG